LTCLTAFYFPNFVGNNVQVGVDFLEETLREAMLGEHQKKWPCRGEEPTFPAIETSWVNVG
jgi:hypothetical protein